ncbi:MAG TPA: metallophosphoesterase [Gemmatimonadaceae bacterium]|nr:metallophosphoesterase [Gemmatimonadaceae bacterium]
MQSDNDPPDNALPEQLPESAIPLDDPVSPDAPAGDLDSGRDLGEPVETEAPAEPESEAQHVTVPPPAILPVVEVRDLDWTQIRASLDAEAIRARMASAVFSMNELLDRDSGTGMLFTSQRSDEHDRAIHVREVDDAAPLWFIGDLHGDLLALETALALITREETADAPARIVFLGDLFDDYGFPLEILVRLFELITAHPERICVITGNHDEALGHDGERFFATVSPADFSEMLNAHAEDELVTACGLTAVRFFQNAPRALFFPDGLLVAHGGFPLVDLHPYLADKQDWNDSRCLTDFVWTRAHPRSRRKIPNRVSRGAQFGYEDFADFCALSRDLGRPVTHMIRGHDHIAERFEIYPAYAATPVLTTVALSRRLVRESFGFYERVPTIARWIRGSLPQVHRLHIPVELVREVYPDPDAPPPASPADVANLP